MPPHLQNEQATPHQGDAAPLVLQIHLDEAPGFDVEQMRGIAQAIVDGGWAHGLACVRSLDDGDHLDVGFETLDGEGLWSQLREICLDSGPLAEELSKHSICVRTGERGWDDARQLHPLA